MERLAMPDNVSITVAPLAGEFLVTIHHKVSPDGFEFASFAFRIPRSTYDIRDLEQAAYARLRNWVSRLGTTQSAGERPPWS